MPQIDVNEEGLLQIAEVYDPIVFITAEGIQFNISMRDTGIEILTGRTVKGHRHLVSIDGHNEVTVATVRP